MQSYDDFYLVPTNYLFFASSVYDNCRFSVTVIFYPPKFVVLLFFFEIHLVVSGFICIFAAYKLNTDMKRLLLLLIAALAAWHSNAEMQAQERVVVAYVTAEKTAISRSLSAAQWTILAFWKEALPRKVVRLDVYWGLSPDTARGNFANSLERQ